MADVNTPSPETPKRAGKQRSLLRELPFLIGIALVLGAFVGIAAFVGGFLNWNFIMAGTASTNGLLFAIAIVLMLAWKVAGWYGLDRWLLPLIGTPWYREQVSSAVPGHT